MKLVLFYLAFTSLFSFAAESENSSLYSTTPQYSDAECAAHDTAVVGGGNATGKMAAGASRPLQNCGSFPEPKWSRYLRLFIGGLSVAFGMATLFFFYRARKILPTDRVKAKKYFVLGLVLFVLSILLISLPKIWPGVGQNQNPNIDLRTT